MKVNMGAVVATVLLVAVSPAKAESLRCNGHSASEGDSKLSVAYKCGPPLLKESYCAPVYGARFRDPLPEPYASAAVPCQVIEEWLYDRGPGNLMATVRFRSGTVQSITYSRSPN